MVMRSTAQLDACTCRELAFGLAQLPAQAAHIDQHATWSGWSWMEPLNARRMRTLLHFRDGTQTCLMYWAGTPGVSGPSACASSATCMLFMTRGTESLSALLRSLCNSVVSLMRSL